MGALYWWIRAGSAWEIIDAFAEVEVIDDPDIVRTVESWVVDELTVDEATAGPLASLAKQRAGQKRDPAYGQLLGRDRVYLRQADPSVDPGEWFTEHDASGRRLRQVEVRPDGTCEATTARDWPMNPPFDLPDPQYAGMEITKEQFEQVWQRAAARPH